MRQKLRAKMKWPRDMAVSTATLFLVFNLSGCQPRSYGLAVESVDTYSRPRIPITIAASVDAVVTIKSCALGERADLTSASRRSPSM